MGWAMEALKNEFVVIAAGKFSSWQPQLFLSHTRNFLIFLCFCYSSFVTVASTCNTTNIKHSHLMVNFQQSQATNYWKSWHEDLHICWIHTHTHTRPFNGPFSGTTRVSRYQKGKNNLDFTEARDSEWQWHQQRYMQVCTSLQTDNHASTPSLSFLQAGCPSCRPTNSVKALKAYREIIHVGKLSATLSMTTEMFLYLQFAEDV